MTAIPFEQPVHYPESDGRPMAESELHRKEMTYLVDALEDHFRGDPRVYVGGNLFLYYKKGNPRAVVALDVFVVRGVPKRLRKTYKLWEEGIPPGLIVEVTSESTREEDLGPKRDCYEQLGVAEYFLYDPTADYLENRLEGLRLVEGRYRPVQPEPDRSLLSRTAGVVLTLEGSRVRLADAATGERLLRFEERTAALEAAEARAKALEDEVARLRHQLEARGSG